MPPQQRWNEPGPEGTGGCGVFGGGPLGIKPKCLIRTAEYRKGTTLSFNILSEA